MDPIKEAFSKIKGDIKTLASELLSAKEEILRLKSRINELELDNSTDIPTQSQTSPTPIQSSNLLPTDQQTHNPRPHANDLAVQAPYSPNSYSSIGNKGVPTDRPTDSQTDQQTQKGAYNQSFSSVSDSISNSSNYSGSPSSGLHETISDFQKASEILESLDSVKKAIRLKFKRLTPQEMLVFSHIYGLEEQNIDEITYKLLAKDLNLSESSIRDYINKLIKKGVPVDKIRQNNKTIVLKISKDLKNIANLKTIQNLRNI